MRLKTIQSHIQFHTYGSFNRNFCFFWVEVYSGSISSLHPATGITPAFGHSIDCLHSFFFLGTWFNLLNFALVKHNEHNESFGVTDLSKTSVNLLKMYYGLSCPWRKQILFLCEQNSVPLSRAPSVMWWGWDITQYQVGGLI